MRCKFFFTLKVLEGFMKKKWINSCLLKIFDVQYVMWKKWHIGECVIWPETSDFTYICKGYTYEMIKASLVYKGAFICSIIVRSISGYNNDFDELTGPVILLLLENFKKDK